MAVSQWINKQVKRFRRQSPWIQFRQKERIDLGVLTMLLAPVFYYTPDNLIFQAMRESIFSPLVELYPQITLICGAVIVFWWRATFFHLFLLALPVHLYYAFMWQAYLSGAISAVGLIFATGIEYKIFSTLWVMERHDGRET